MELSNVLRLVLCTQPRSDLVQFGGSVRMCFPTSCSGIHPCPKFAGLFHQVMPNKGLSKVRRAYERAPFGANYYSQAHRTAAAMRAIFPVLLLGVVLVACRDKRPAQLQAEATPPKFTPEEVTHSLTLLVREAEKGKERFAALDAVRDSAPYVSEFLRLFPSAEVNYRYFTNTDEPGFNVGVDLHDRYEFSMQLPVRFDSERREVIGYDEPRFSIWEVATVTRGPSGIAQEALNPAGERHFSSAEWRTLVAHGGDFSALGYLMHTNRPVAGFRDRKIQP